MKFSWEKLLTREQVALRVSVMQKKKPPKKWWYVTIGLPGDYREYLEARIAAGETPTVAWWVRRAARLLRETEKGA